MESDERPRGVEVYNEFKKRLPDLFDWYYKYFYPDVFEKGRVEHRLKELLRLKLSKTQGCFT